jgi:alpha-glucosidase
MRRNRNHGLLNASGAAFFKPCGKRRVGVGIMVGRFFALAFVAFAALAGAASAETAARVTSPDGALAVEIAVNGEGRPSYAVTRRGVPVIAPSRLGFAFANAPRLERSLAITGQTTSSADQTWEQPWGERRYVRNHYNELRVSLAETSELHRQYDIVVRVYDDGLGLRYEFPAQPNMAEARISDELTEFNLAQPGTAWWIPALEWNRAEYLYNRTPIEAVGTAQTPMTVRTADGLHISIHEAALVDYAGMNLRRSEGRSFQAALTQGADRPAVVRTTPFATPWRTLEISDTAAGLAMSSLILNLNDPNAIGDVSWFHPMKYVGIWWEMHLGHSTWSTGPHHGATTENAIRHIDFAARNGFGGVLIEGWNKGWDGDWFGDGRDFNFTEATPDFDLPRVAAYARAHHVQLIGHNETGGNIDNYERQLDAAFTLYESLGMHSVKTGYVADAGAIRTRDGRFIWHESQEMAVHHLHVVQEAARHHIAIDAHEPIKDTGLRRTYPNWIDREGARGMEYNAWGQPGNPPEHETNLVFTRLLAGPMDFTPGIFGMRTNAPDGVATTWAKQLALYVVIYSPIQMAADLLENYEANPGPFQFIKDVPTDWDDTRVLNGEIGDYVTIARKDRNSPDWYLGAITDEQPRSLVVRLDFLQPGRRYRAEIYRDGPDAAWNGKREDIVIEQRTVTSADALTLNLAPGGGEAIRFHRL